jgi:hypothetical protein
MANFNFKSPSVKFQEIDRSFASTPSLGITSVGMVGETLKGPAFSPVLITDRTEFRRYFGGTSTVKFPDTSGKMKYLAPTYANAFLEEGNQLYFTRILGKSGYNAGKAFAITVGGNCLTSTSAQTSVFSSSTGTTTISTTSVTFTSNSVNYSFTITGNGDYNNVSSISFVRNSSSVFTASSAYVTVSDYTNSIVDAATSAQTQFSSGIEASNTGRTYLDIVITSATGSSFTNFNNLPITFAFDSIKQYFTGVTNYLSVSGYVESSQTSYILYSSYTFSAASTSVPISGLASFTSFTYTAQTDPTYDNMVVAILRSRGSGLQDAATFNISSVTGSFGNTIGSPLSNFTLTAVGANVTENFQFNLDVTSSNYIAKAMGSRNSDTKSNLWVDAVYPDLIRKIATENLILDIKNVLTLTSTTFSNYKSQYTNPETPWLVSELNGSKVSRLFKFISFSDGNAANREVKIAIENINPTTKEFDIVVRDFTDTDANPSILERFGRCTMNPDDNNFIMRRIGGVYSDSDTSFLEDAKSAYIYVNVNVNAPITSIPCGFEGYNLRNYSTSSTGAATSALTPTIIYKTRYATTDKVLKTYLGISEKAFDTASTNGLSINDDLFKFLGANIAATSLYKTKGFHLDSGATGTYIDSVGNEIGQFSVGAGAISNTVSVAAGTYYADSNRRKFVVVPAGGFDGWDVNYETVAGRSIGATFAQGGVNAFINSDYNAYLEAYQLYEDTERTPINLFSTPGIDWLSNSDLVADALEIVEEIRQDSLYIIDAPDASLTDTSTVVAGSYVDSLDSANIDSSYAATYVPYIKRKDVDSNTNIFIPPTGEILKAMALSDRTSFIWFATAGLNRGGLPNARDVRKTFKESDRDTLYLGRLNPIVKFSNNTPGIFVYGQKTLQVADSKLDRIDVRRLLLYAKQIISSQARLYLFEPNDDVLATNFIAESNKKLKVIQDNRGLQTFRVRLDNSLNTPESRDRNEIYFVIELLPIGAVEFIGLTFVVNKSTTAIQFNG